MPDAPAAPQARRTRRRGNNPDDTDELPQAVGTEQPTQGLEKPPLAPSSFLAKASGAAGAGPAHFVDPTRDPPRPGFATGPPPAPPTAAFAPPPVAPPASAASRGLDGGSKEAASPPALAALTRDDQIYNLDFDALSYEGLLTILKRVSRTQMEELVLREQQNQLLEQQEAQRIEKFLDLGVEYRGTNTCPPQLESRSSEDDLANRTSEANEEGYAYHVMLTHLFEALNRNNEGSAMAERNQIPVPILEKIGKKKTAISNFGRICDAFHRPMEDVKDFIEKELSTRGNLDSNNALILKFEIRKATDFDRTLIKYLDEYVKCYSCHRIDTILTKDGRRLELRCNWCTATRTVQAASSATYSAQIEKRSRQRAAMTL